MKKILSIMMISLILLTSVTKVSAASPSPKEEVVYGLLNYDGSVKNLYVVNIFDGGSVTDYGNYDEIKNMTTDEPITRLDDMITVNTKADKFYYQGNLIRKELPWLIDIKYYINDKELSGNELAGMSGRLKITISVTQNYNLDSTFYENYGLQIALLLNNSLCSDITADKATIVEAGGNKQINFTVLPANTFEGIVTADVINFEMEPISINAIRMAFDLDIGSSEYFEQFSELIKSEFIKGIEELDNGAGELLNGLNELSDGIKDYVEGVNAFKEGIGNISSGAEEIYKGATSLNLGLSDLIKQNDSINKGAYTLMQTAFDAINTQLSEMDLKLPELTPENYSHVLSNIPELNVIKIQLDGVIQFVQGLKSYTEGVEQLGKGAGELAEGTKKFRESSGGIKASVNAVYDGAVKINSGIKALNEGMAEYKEGTNKFRSEISDINIKSEIEEQINNLMEEIFGSNKKAISFASDKNTEITSLQFLLKTDSIKIISMASNGVAEPVKLTFWQKLLKLFGLYKE